MLQIQTQVELVKEVERARVKHPGNKHLLAALMEEVGELAKALMEQEGTDRVRAEALQVACVALRIFEEGEPAFPQEDAAIEDEQETEEERERAYLRECEEIDMPGGFRD